jgi:hypothetical protein
MAVKNVEAECILDAGGGLRLIVTDDGFKRWALRITINGTRAMRRLGTFPTVSLEAARDKADTIRRADKAGIDLQVEKRRKAEAATTFRQMFDVSFAPREKQLFNAKHLKQ